MKAINEVQLFYFSTDRYDWKQYHERHMMQEPPEEEFRFK